MNIQANKQIGRVLKDLRKGNHLRQEDVARTLGKPQSYVSKIESGEKSLHLYEVFAYADALQTPRVELLGKIEQALTGTTTILK